MGAIAGFDSAESDPEAMGPLAGFQAFLTGWF
jgi:hypothetical protein